MPYPELFKAFDEVRWDLETNVPCHAFDRTRLADAQAQTIKMNAITEGAALPATELFLRDNRDDSDFCAFMSIWFYEEQKHALLLMEFCGASGPISPRARPSCTRRVSSSTRRRCLRR